MLKLVQEIAHLKDRYSTGNMYIGILLKFEDSEKYEVPDKLIWPIYRFSVFIF